MIMWPRPMPAWIVEAMAFRGLREIPGKQHNKTIINWLIALKAWWREDETPWCATFVAHCLREAGLPIPKNWFRAKEYAIYGSAVSKGAIPFGAICVKSRTGGGHVFFAVAKSSDGNTIYGLGGNQGNMVCIVPFHISVIDEVRWPPSGAIKFPLPVASGADIGAASGGRGEA